MEVAHVNPKGLEMSLERIHVHDRSHIWAGGPKGFGMIQEVVEVSGAEVPLAEGTHVDAFNKVAIVLDGLWPPKDVTSIGVEGLVIEHQIMSELQ
jgi:hypothetical protein